MAEMMLSCAVPPMPSWSLDPNVTNVSASSASESQGHAVMWDRVGTGWGREKLQPTRGSTLKQKKGQKKREKKKEKIQEI